MDIIKEAVLRIERDAPRQVPVRDSGSQGGRRLANELSRREPLPVEELAKKRIYHASMRDERVHIAFTNLRTHVIQRTGKRSCSIAVSALTEGGGASFVAMNLAAAFASDSSGSAILVDCNFSGPRFEQLGDNDTVAGVTDYLDDSGSTLNQFLTDVGIPRLRLLGGGTLRNTQREFFTRPRTKKMFEELGNQYDDCAVIIDAPPSLVSANTSVIANYCDAVLLVVPYGSATQQDVRAAVRSMPPEKLLGSVFNNVPHWHVTG